MGNENAINKIKEFRISDGVDSDHLPLTMKMRKKKSEEQQRIEDTIEEIDDGQGEDTISIEEMKLIMEKMKIKKACGIDGIAIEVWLFAGEGVKKNTIRADDES